LERREPKILLVDDDELSRRMMELLLSGDGYNYDTASNGEEAVSAVRAQSFDIVLMDLQMPVMDGFEATRIIRAWETEKRHTPIVALTAMLFDDEIQNCLDVGMDGCIEKPFNTEQLFQLIESYVDQSTQPTLSEKSQESKNTTEELMILDIQSALPRFGKSLRAYQNFLKEFMDDLPERIEQFQTVFLSGNYHALADYAHNLKGISASMGATQLSHLSRVLDETSQDGDPLQIQQSLDDINEHVHVLQKVATELLSGYTQQ
jgi:CheY-like chemotaxis protein/HPt (histidine-containing phosphotransfer) domain-containing protein